MSSACCTRTPIGSNVPVQVQRIAGLDTYVTGNASSQRGVVVVYDIFGFYPQTLQGADRLAQHLDAVALVPDLFEGTQADKSWLPPNTEEKKAAFGKFRSTTADPAKNLDKLKAVIGEAKTKYPSVQTWAVLGLCWGGKLAAMISAAGTDFDVSGQVHPSGLDDQNASDNVTPHIVLASPDEPKDQVASYKAALESRRGLDSYVETYDNMFHGWMGARANLDDAENKRQYERGYKQVADFFAKHL